MASLTEKGIEKIEWVGSRMKVLTTLLEEYRDVKPLKGVKVGACLHITAETANLIIALKEAGADVFLCASNPLSTKGEIVDALTSVYKVDVFAKPAESEKEYIEFIDKTLSNKVDITIDDGADLTVRFHTHFSKLYNIKFGLEETTTGVNRLRALEKDNKLLYPIIAVNNARTKNLFDNRYGTGQSSLDGIIRATNILLAGKTITVVGYGWCGRGIATRARGLGANVIVCEINPISALEAVMDGFQVMPVKTALSRSDLVCTATGNIAVITYEDVLNHAKNGVILANSGHFNVEIDVVNITKNAKKITYLNNGLIWKCLLPNNKIVYILGEGRLVNLVCAEGHPAEVMDMSFSTQFLSILIYLNQYKNLPNRIIPVTEEIEEKIASIKLQTMGLTIDSLTPQQVEYMNSWKLE
ncbi:MAG: adenosylhomocysteinase [Planctomycetota bacterium]